VDIAATLPQLDFSRSGNDEQRLRNLAAAITTIRADLGYPGLR